MLNELLLVERGARSSGIAMAQRHPDVKNTRRMPTLLVRLDANGHVAEVRPVPASVTPWTLRDGQHNSFAFVQPKAPLCAVPPNDDRLAQALAQALDKRDPGRRTALVALARDAELNAEPLAGWPGVGLFKRLRERRQQLASLETSEAVVVLASIHRFLRACDPAEGGNAQRFGREIVEQLADNLDETAGGEWLDVASALLGEGSGALLIDAMDCALSILDQRTATAVSEALQASSARGSGDDEQRCGLTGLMGKLLDGKSPQPNLPILGQTFLLARNKDIPANARYGRTATDTMPVNEETVVRLAAALTALTTPDLKGKSWRSLPGEMPKQQDLLLAFVDGITDSPIADLLVDDPDDDLPDEDPRTAPPQSGAVEFLRRCQQLVEMVRAAVPASFHDRQVQLIVLRKVDPANRKVVFTRTPTVDELYEAAVRWAAGTAHVPVSLTFRVVRRGSRSLQSMRPLHLGPLALIEFSKQLFLRDGQKRQEIGGLPASEALALFLEPVVTKDGAAARRARRFLRLVLARRASLCERAVHAVRRDSAAAARYDGRELLRTVTVLGMLLHKLGRRPAGDDHDGGYMNETAFKLGQLLAAADVVHVGYCADVRSGDVPPSLLGNQVFTMAQTSPDKALAVLGRRWKPYQAWARRAAYLRGRATAMIGGDESQRGWAIRSALRHARELQPLADDLAPLLAALEPQQVNDEFRARLLLGYMAGLPKMQKTGETEEQEQTTPTAQES